ncbi:MAG: YcxB family protein, partial [Prochloraceae cyanobacterium]
MKKTLNENKKPSLIAERKITVNKNGLSLEAETLQIFVDWDLFDRFSETDLLFILYFHDRESQIIPIRYFENSEEIEYFRELLKNKAKNLDDNSVFREEIAEKDGVLNLKYQLEAKDYLEAKQASKFYSKLWILYYPIAIPFFLGVGFNYLWSGIYGSSLLETNLSQKDALI